MMKLIFSLIELGFYLFVLASPFVLGVIIIKKLIKKIQKKSRVKNDINSDHGPYGTGWTWNESTGLWEPPGYNSSPITIKRTEPTYEEWRKSKMEESDSTYHFRGTEVPNEPVVIPPREHRKEYSHCSDSTFKAQSKPRTEQANTRYRTWDQPFWEQEQRKKNPPVYKEPRVVYPKYNPETNTQTQSACNASTTDSKYKNGYEARSVLTHNEMRNYRTLNDAAYRKGYSISTKMRLADLVKPRNEPQYMARFRKISQYHVDFVVLDNQMRVKAVIELDDSSHDTEKRKERDAFVDELLRDCGIRIIHTRHITPDILDNI